MSEIFSLLGQDPSILVTAMMAVQNRRHQHVGLERRQGVAGMEPRRSISVLIPDCLYSIFG
jgi:hypothetical protein